MLQTDVLKAQLQNQIFADRLTDIYVDNTIIPYQTNRYINAITTFEKHFGMSTLYSA